MFKKSANPVKKNRDRGDKIFDNNYNEKTIEYEHFNDIKISSNFELNRLSQYYDAQDYYTSENLVETIDKIWKTTEWASIYGNVKKIPKNNLSEIFTYIISHIRAEMSTECEIFVSISDFLGVSYATLYEMIPPVYKARVLKELNDKYKVLENSKTTSLF